MMIAECGRAAITGTALQGMNLSHNALCWPHMFLRMSLYCCRKSSELKSVRRVRISEALRGFRREQLKEEVKLWQFQRGTQQEDSR